MPDFCCKMLNERGAIVSSADIIATNLEAAIEHASALLHTSNQSEPSRRVYCTCSSWFGPRARLGPSWRRLPHATAAFA
jgi:hypothetical protein